MSCALSNWPAGPGDEPRVEYVSQLGWTGGRVLAMLGQFEAAQLRHHREKETSLRRHPLATTALFGAGPRPPGCLGMPGHWARERPAAAAA